jgi:hypothetical protein
MMEMRIVSEIREEGEEGREKSHTIVVWRTYQCLQASLQLDDTTRCINNLQYPVDESAEITLVLLSFGCV